MGLGGLVREAWGRVVAGVNAAKSGDGERKTAVLPLGPAGVLGLWRGTGSAAAHYVLPKPTAANLRRFAETPAARRAINCIKDRIACMDWRIEVKPDAPAEENPTHDDGEAVVMNGAPGQPIGRRAAALTAALREPNGVDSFRTLIEQVIEDLLVVGCGR